MFHFKKRITKIYEDFHEGPRRRILVHSFFVVLCVFFVLFVSIFPLAAQLRYVPTAFRPDEVLTYKVKWSFIRLGTLTIHQEPADTSFPQFLNVWLNGESSVPFVNVFFKSVSLLHRVDPISYLYELHSGQSDQVITSYVYDPANVRMFGLESARGEVTRLDTLPAMTPYYDGIGLFMYARAASGSDTTVSLPTIMDFAMGSTAISFSSQIETIEIDSFNEPQKVYAFTGQTDWTGSSFGGMTGEFRGWVSTDSTRKVLRAEVKIFLGSVVIELEKAPENGAER